MRSSNEIEEVINNEVEDKLIATCLLKKNYMIWNRIKSFRRLSWKYVISRLTKDFII